MLTNMYGYIYYLALYDELVYTECSEVGSYTSTTNTKEVDEMPYVTIRIIKELSTPEIKAKLIARMSEAVADVLADTSGANREKVLANLWCVVEEIPFDSWGVGGVQASRAMLKEVVELGE